MVNPARAAPQARFTRLWTGWQPTYHSGSLLPVELEMQGPAETLPAAGEVSPAVSDLLPQPLLLSSLSL